VLKEAWEGSKRSEESVVSYMLLVRERLLKMTELVQENLSRAQRQQKRWYDSNALSREFSPGDRVLVLLPSSTNKLWAQWQRSYEVKRRIGKVDYEVEMFDKRKKKRILHVNMLNEWIAPSVSTGYFMGGEAEEFEEDGIELLEEEVAGGEALYW